MNPISASLSRLLGATAQEFQFELERGHLIANQHIVTRVLDEPLLAYVAPPIQHHKENKPGNTPDLRITVATSQTLGSKDVEAELDQLLLKGDQNHWVYKGNDYFAFRGATHKGLSVLDWHEKRALYIAREPRLDLQDGGSPFLAILHWWLARKGFYIVHAGAFGSQNCGAVLLVGKGGSGKSTAAVSSLFSDLGFLGEDYCLISPSSKTVNSLYATAKLTPTSQAHFPSLSQHKSNQEFEDQEKSLFYLFPSFADKLLSELPASAILIPTMAGRGKSRLSEATPGQGLLALAPSTLFQFRFAEDLHQVYSELREFISDLPVYKLTIGSDIAGIPDLVKSVLPCE